MKNDYEVKLYTALRHKGLTQKQAAARAGMSERTCSGYLKHLLVKSETQQESNQVP